MRGLLAAFAGLSLLATPVLAKDDDATLRMTGTGIVTVVPDEASVSLGVVTIAETASEALEANSPAVAKIIDMLKASGVASEDVGTERFDVSPRYDRQRDGAAPEITGYQVTNMVRARISKLEDLGTILDKAIKAGATSIGGVQMSFGDREGALDEARVLAVGDATRKAQLVAEAAGVTLGPILLISEGGGGPGPMPRAMGMRAAQFEAAPIEAGSTAIQAQVHMIWELEAPN